MNGMSWESLNHSVPYTHEKPCTIFMIIMDGEHYVTVDWITLKACGWAAVAACALRFWQVTLGSSFTQFHLGLVSWVPQIILVNSGPLPSQGSCFEKHPSDAAMHQALPTSQLSYPPSCSLEELCRLPPTHWLWLGGGGATKGQSAHSPPPVPHTITLLMFCKNFTLALLECLLSAFPSEASQKKKKSEEVNRLKLQHREDTMPGLWCLR